LIVWWYWEELDKFKIAYEWNRNVKIVWRLDIQNIISNLKIANLFLFPSQIDSFWLVMLESMSMWIPVISYNISWAKEIVKNDFNWYLVDSDDEFIKKSYDILSNSSLQNNLSIGAVKTANTFTINNFEKQLSEIF
jgi:glycosyltransferase involved in cell wall biosynthesis